jgi:phosphoribosylanthranilate isomerase
VTMQVKVCGVTRPEDAVLAVELGAALLGLNFWPGSPRCVSPAQGREVADAVRGRATLVGVFVDQGRAAVEEAAAAVGLDAVQLHGDETAADAAALTLPVVKALRLGDGDDAAAAAAPFASCWGLLFDAALPGLYGGTGHAWAWERVAGAFPGRRVLLAGGVAPGRVRGLVARCNCIAGTPPWGIDVCSGVESAPGRKDAARLRALFEEVRDVESAPVV